jgi:TPR repeat protein
MYLAACMGIAVTWLLAPLAHASDGRELALIALRTEFERDGVSASADELTKGFKEACEAGYNPACRRDTWLTDGRPDPAKVLPVFESSCESGDPVGCLVMGWMLDIKAQKQMNADERDKLWRKAARQLKSDCDGGFLPACADFAGYLYYNRGVVSDPRPAIARWKTACDSGDAASCTQLARLSTSGGPGVVANVAAARTYATRACGLGYVDGCAVLGSFDDKTWDVARLDEFYGDLCDKGHRNSCWTLARSYYDGLRQEPAEGRANGLFLRACELKHPRACFESGRWVMDHQGPADEAARLFGTACNLGDAAGCSAQVDLILSNKVQIPFKESRDAFDVACEERQSIAACTALGYALLAGTDIPRDAERARLLLQRACTGPDSDATACSKLAGMYVDGLGGDRDRTEASKYFRWSCNAGIADSCMQRGVLLTSDVGVRRDDAEAVAMFTMACDGGLPLGCLEAGRILDAGTFVQQNLPEATKFYDRACTARIPAACTALGIVRERGPDGTPDPAGARAAYQAAIDAGATTDARRLLARLLWNGMGGKVEKGSAKQLCKAACQAGDAKACGGPQALTAP